MQTPPRSKRTYPLFPSTTLFRSGCLHEQIGNRPAAADVDHMPSDRVSILRHAAAHPLPGVIDQDFAHFWHRRKIAHVDAAPDPDPFALFRERSEERRGGKGCVRLCRSCECTKQYKNTINNRLKE